MSSAGRIITFYSYKGGTGRSLLLADIAWILASNGRRVLAVDWDLEAPGLHRYFHPFLLDKDLVASPGVIELLWEFAMATGGPADANEPADWYRKVARVAPYVISANYAFPGRGTVDLLPAGRQDPSYAKQVATFDWGRFYDELGGGTFLEALRDDMRTQYDYVLIDSRTGVGDAAGVCTIQLPDMLVNCFTANTQSIDGSAAVAASVRRRRDADSLPIYPVPSRIDDGEQQHLDAARDRWRSLHTPFLPIMIDAAEYWGSVEIPYRTFYAYEEILPAVGDRPQQLGTVLAAGERITGYLTSGAVDRLAAVAETERRQLVGRYLRERVPAGTVPRVYLLYAQDDPADAREVERFWRFLRDKGIDASLDGGGPATADSLRRADYVLVVCASGNARWPDAELSLLRESLYADRATWMAKILLVLLPSGDRAGFPAFLLPDLATVYRVADYTVPGAEPLLRVLTGQPVTTGPTLGTVPILPEHADTTTSSAHILLTVEPDAPDLFRVACVTVRPGFKPERGRALSQVPAAELHSAAGGLLLAAERILADVPDQVGVEIFLPSTMLNESVEWWSGPDGEPLALSYPVVTRSLDRLNAVRWHRTWRQRWPRPGRPTKPLFLTARDTPDPSRLEAGLALDPSITTVVFDGPPSGRTINAVLRAGIPFALWNRVHHAERAVDDLLRGLTELDPSRLPGEVRAARLDALATGPESRGQHIGLLWDDPFRLPT